jgi:acyl-CoA thioesterase-1
MDLSYGSLAAPVEGLWRRFVIGLMLAFVLASAAHAEDAGERPIKLAVLGDSLSAGLGLPAQSAFPAKLEQALRANGVTVDVLNAGVSGDTASDGLARLDWSIPEDIDAVIVELGANDALRGIDPKVTRAALDEIVKRLRQRHVAVLLAGMYAPRNLGQDYADRFDRIFADLAKAHDVPLYPFFLDGVATDAGLNQADGMHPTAAGVDVIVARILPGVKALLASAAARPR